MPKIIVKEEVTRIVRVGGAGIPGPAGPGVPAGGTAGQLLRKATGDFNTQWSDTAPDTDKVAGVAAATVIDRLGAVETGQASGVIGRATQADLLAVVPADEDAVGYVGADPDPGKNGNYHREGGSWVQSSFDRVAQVENAVEVADAKAESGLSLSHAVLAAALLEESYNGISSVTDLPQVYTLSALGDFFELDFITENVSGAGKYSILGTKGVSGSNCVGFASTNLSIRDSAGSWHIFNTTKTFGSVRRVLRVEVTSGGWEVSVDGTVVGTIAALDGKSLAIGSVGNAYGAEFWPGKIYSLEIGASDGTFAAGVPSVAIGSIGHGVALTQVERGIIPQSYDQRIATAESDVDTLESVTNNIVVDLRGAVDYARFNGVDAEVDLGEMFVLEAEGDYFEVEGRAYQMAHYTDTLGMIGLAGAVDSFGFYDSDSVWLKPSDGVYVQWDGLSANFTEFHTLKLVIVNAGADWELFIDGVSVGTKPRSGATFGIRNVGRAYAIGATFATIDTRGLSVHTSTQDATFASLAYLPGAKNLSIAKAPSAEDLLEATDIYIKKTADSLVQFYVKGGGGDRWIEYPLARVTEAYDPTFTTPNHNLDSWNITEGFEVSRIGLGFSRTLQIIHVGAWECAIRESGAADFIGSHAHGDEVLSSATLLVDGVLSDLSTTEEMSAKSATFIQRSTLFRCNTQTPVANFIKRYEITADGITITNDLEWLEVLTLVDSYLAMLPIRRTSDGTPSGTQITDTGIRSPGYDTEDLSAAGFSPTYTDASLVNIWGSTSGIGAEVELLERPDLPNREFNFSPATQYNKLYFDVSGNHTTQVGEKWRVKARYRLTTAN